MFISYGILRYIRNENFCKLIAEIDPEIVRYYRSFIPLYIKVNKPKHTPHISVVRHEVPNFEFWGKYEGQEVEFSYENIIRFGETYCWMDAYCDRFVEIRLELGLPPNRVSVANCFHFTLGNFKNLR